MPQTQAIIVVQVRSLKLWSLELWPLNLWSLELWPLNLWPVSDRATPGRDQLELFSVLHD